MIQGKGTLREQMMRCYLLGYITTRHNDYKLVTENPEYKTYRSLKKEIARETLIRYGMNSKIAGLVINAIAPFERIISIMFCINMFFSSSLKYLFTPKKTYNFCKICPKLNIQEKRFITLYQSAGYHPQEITLVDIPQQICKYSTLSTVSVFSGITYAQIVKSFWYAVSLSWFIFAKYRKKDLLFRSYSSFPFFLFFFFVSNLNNSNELVFFNHYDRWMYLFGNSPLKKTYIQHGKLWKDHIMRINCDVAYYICKSQKDILEFTLFNNKPLDKYRKVFDYSGLEKLKNNGSKDLLIVCLESYASKHENIVRQLKGVKINIYLKPHPADNKEIYLKFQKQHPEIVILDKFDYPKVDYVISYDSTLADEYEMLDSKVIKYNDEDYIDKYNQMLTSL